MKKYLLLSILTVFGFCANGQVYNAGTNFATYYNINPDTLLNYKTFPYTDETYGINLFGTPASDIEINAHSDATTGGTEFYIKVTSLDVNTYLAFGRMDSLFAVADSSWNVTKVAKPLNAGDQLNGSGTTWDNTVLYISDHSANSGANKNINDWIGGEKFLGVKYQNGTTSAYAWVRLQCKAKDSCYVKDFSASAFVVGVEEIAQQEVIIYPNPASTYFYLKNNYGNSFDLSRLKLRDINGQEVKFASEINGDKIKIRMDKIFADGYYILEYISENGVFSKKILKTAE